MSVDAHKNFAYSTVATAPVTPTAGVALTVQTGDAAKFPAVPFNATVWPIGAIPTIANSEIVRVTAIAVDVLTITRTTGTEAVNQNRSIIIGDQIAATITAKTLTDAETPADSAVVFTDNTTGNVTSSSHGYAPKSGANSHNFLNGAATPAYSDPRILAVVSKTTTYTATTADDLILVTAASSWTLSLPAAASNTGKVFYIKKTDADSFANFVTVDPNASETIDGLSTYPLYTQNETIAIVSDGTNWQII